MDVIISIKPQAAITGVQALNRKYDQNCSYDLNLHTETVTMNKHFIFSHDQMTKSDLEKI